ncbi:MAG: low molecular weight phosphotyrosine protein phosphatase [Lachnospiraceae bacterium]|nr:low molecular weight phosphotyrosine protein phosphatase [Lachnospiraceae bacterium]
MIKVLFVCHGNICRSPMAEFVLKDMVKKRGMEELFLIASCATSTEEIGNDVHPGTKRKLASEGIKVQQRRAVQLRKSDYDTYDYLIAMDARNISNMRRIIGEDNKHKVSCLLDFTSHPRDIADPWYTGNFDITYQDIVEGCEAFLQHILG